MKLQPIGYVWNGITSGKEFANVISEIEVLPQFVPGLYRLEESKEIDVIFIFHRNIGEGFNLRVHPQGDPFNPEVGVFASRSPFRPNPIGLQRVVLLDVKNDKLHVQGLDAYHGTPVLDIKPAKRRDGL